LFATAGQTRRQDCVDAISVIAFTQARGRPDQPSRFANTAETFAPRSWPSGAAVFPVNKSNRIRKLKKLNKALVAARQERDRAIQARHEARDKAIERVGRALLGELWIGELATKEWKAGKKSGADHYRTTHLPSSGKRAAMIARAHFRSRASAEQYEQVSRWLAKELPNPHFNFATDFEPWFRKKFPNAPLNSTEIRKNAVHAAWKAGQRPGRGGNIDWKSFHKDLEARMGLKFDLKTIKRDVKDLLGK
jgi:hypothetical protein